MEVIEDIISYYLDKLNNNNNNNNKSYKYNDNQKYILKGLTYSEILINNLKEKKNIEYLMYIGKNRKKLDTDLEKEKNNYDVKEIVERAFNEKIKKCQEIKN